MASRKEKFQVSTKIIFLVQGLLLMTIALIPRFTRVCDRYIVGASAGTCEASWLILAFGVIHIIGGIISFFKHCLDKPGPYKALACCVAFYVIPFGLVVYHAIQFRNVWANQPKKHYEIIEYTLLSTWILCALYVTLFFVQVTIHIITIACTHKLDKDIGNTVDDEAKIMVDKQ